MRSQIVKPAAQINRNPACECDSCFTQSHQTPNAFTYTPLVSHASVAEDKNNLI